MGDQDFHPLSSLARFEPLPPRAPASTSVHKISSGRRFPTIHLNRVHGVNCDCQILENLFPDICPRLFTCLFLILCIRDFFYLFSLSLFRLLRSHFRYFMCSLQVWEDSPSFNTMQMDWYCITFQDSFFFLFLAKWLNISGFILPQTFPKTE